MEPDEKIEQEEIVETEDGSKKEMESEDEIRPLVNQINEKLASLQESFDEKIANDAYKNKLFDDMHRELVRYQNGVVDRIIEPFALDLIQAIDAIKSDIHFFEEKEPTEENYQKLVKALKNIPQDLEDILYRQSIEPYQVSGADVDVRKQKIIQMIPTENPVKNNQVAVRIASGYEKEGKVLRPERIKVYKYNKVNSDSQDGKEDKTKSL